MNSQTIGIVYLIHLDTPIGGKHPRQHYCGWALNLDNRVREHRESALEYLTEPKIDSRALSIVIGRGSKFLAWANMLGIKWNVVRVWESSPIDFEKKLKNTHNLSRYCPICNH